MKFKVGDKVRVKIGIDTIPKGGKGVIMRIDTTGLYPYLVKFNLPSLPSPLLPVSYNEKELELVGELKEPKIFIFRK